MELMSAKQAAELWGISPRRVAILCSEGRISGAQMVGRSWVVPAHAKKPADARVKSGRYIKKEEVKGRIRDQGNEE